MVSWLVGWLVGSLVDWLVGWLYTGEKLTVHLALDFWWTLERSGRFGEKTNLLPLSGIELLFSGSPVRSLRMKRRFLTLME